MKKHRTSFIASCSSVKKGETVTLGSFSSADICVPPPLMTQFGAMAELSVGSIILQNNKPLLRILSRGFLPFLPSASLHGNSYHEEPCCHAEVLRALKGQITVETKKEGVSLAFITLSDKGSVGERRDESGPAIVEITQQPLSISYHRGFILPDTPERLKSLVLDLAYHQGYDLIITTGGTGLSPRDTTPEALLSLLDRRLHGFEHVMMSASLKQTASAAISRAFAGTLGQSLLISLPGSKKAVTENLSALLPCVPHALQKLQGDLTDCGVLTDI